MKAKVQFLLSVALLGLLSITDATAQERSRGSGGWDPSAAYNRNFDPKTVETVSGEVTEVGKITAEKGMSDGIHLTLKTDRESISVYLGPAWYIEQQDSAIKVKDVVEVKGSRIAFEGKPAILAAEVKRGDEVLQLRDATGVPNWFGWRRR